MHLTRLSIDAIIRIIAWKLTLEKESTGGIMRSARQVLKRIFQIVLPNSSRHYLYLYNKKFSESMVAGGLVLDAGAGEEPYRDLFGQMQYESTDFGEVPSRAYAHVTYICDLCKGIPVESERYDYIVFNQVLEHLPYPQLALTELARVLKSGGRILCSAPLFYEEHEQPYDFFRYTQFAYRHMFAVAGLQIETLERVEGYFGTTAYMLQCMAKYLPLLPRTAGLLIKLLILLISPFVLLTKIGSLLLAAVFYRLDMVVKIVNVGFPKNYVVIAVKPAAVSG